LITGGISPGKIYFFILQKYAEPQSRVSPLLSRLLEFDDLLIGITCNEYVIEPPLTEHQKKFDT